MKKRLLLLPLLLVTTSCVPIDYNITISYDEGAIKSVVYYELNDTHIEYTKITEFDNLSIIGIVEESYIDTLMQSIQETRYIDKVPLFMASDPILDFYGDVLYINFINNEKFILSENLAILYDGNNEEKEHLYGFNEGLKPILEECKENHLK